MTDNTTERAPALVEEIYRGDTTIGLVRQKGNLGIGTFNNLDGEMALFDGLAYCLRPTGDAELVSDDIKTPFAIATEFEGDTEDRLDSLNVDVRLKAA